MKNRLLNYIKSYYWECFATVRLPPNIPPDRSHEHVVRDVLRPLGKFLKSRVAAFTVASYGHGQHRSHLHILLLSKSRVLSTRISDAQDYLRSTRTTLNSHENAIDLRPYLEDQHPEYTVKHMLYDSDKNWYDKKLLEELKTKGATH